MSQLRAFLETVRFEHTIFALPFAYLGMILAAEGFPGWRTFLWITVAMAAARTVAFAVNRYADRHYDARNPRTRDRPIPSGRLSPQTTLLYGGLALSVLILAAWQLNLLALQLLPAALVLLIGSTRPPSFFGSP
jgi:4-hydroxybenzoate polyprenyltransferase